MKAQGLYLGLLFFYIRDVLLPNSRGAFYKIKKEEQDETIKEGIGGTYGCFNSGGSSFRMQQFRRIPKRIRRR